MLYNGYLIIVDGWNVKKNSFGISIAFGKSTSQRIYLEHPTKPKTQNVPYIAWMVILRGQQSQKNKSWKLRLLSPR